MDYLVDVADVDLAGAVTGNRRSTCSTSVASSAS
jgi:hypothetical protein